MAKIIDLQEAARKKQSKMHTLEHFVQTEFTRDNPNLSVKFDRYRGSLLYARIIAGKGWKSEEVLKIEFDEDAGDVGIESINVFDRLYQYLAKSVAEKYEAEFKAKEVEIYVQ